MSLAEVIRQGKNFSKNALATVLTASVLLSSSCSDKPNKPVEPPKEIITFADNVKFFNEGVLWDMEYSPENGDILFPIMNPSISSLNLKPGDIIISEVPHPNIPFGFLRKVQSISSDYQSQSITTSQATLAEVIKEGEISVSKKLTPYDIVSSSSLSGVSKPTSSESFDFNIPINNVVIYDADGDTIRTKNDQVVANGIFSFNYDFDFYADIDLPFKLKTLRFTNTAKQSVELRINSNPSFTTDKETTFARYVLASVPVPGTPLYVVPIIEVNAGINGEAHAKLTTGISQSAELSAGILKENGKWSAPVNFTSNFDFQAPTINGNANFKGFVGPNLNLMVYGLIGGYGGIDGFLRLDVNSTRTPSWKLYGGLEATLGVKDEIFGWFDYEKEVLNYEKLLAEDATKPLKASLVVTPETGTAPLEVLLDASKSTGEIKEFNFKFDDTTSYVETPTSAPDGAFDGKTKHVYKAPRRHISSVIIYDKERKSSFALDTVYATETALKASLIASPNSGFAPLEVLLDASGSSGGVIEYWFDFGEDNIYIEKSGSAPDGAFDGKTKHTYLNSGKFIPIATVLNQQAQQATAKDTVDVSESLLKASLVARPDSGKAPLEVLLDASGSSGPIIDYEFNFGDGISNYHESQSNAPDGAFDGKTKHTYALKGVYIPEVYVSKSISEYKIARDTVNVSEGVIQKDSITIQPGPEGKDAYVQYTLWPDGLETYSGEGNTTTLEVHREYISNHAVAQAALVEFPLSQVPQNASISSATLKFYGWMTINSISGTPTLAISKLDGPWTESTVKWNTLPGSQFITSKQISNEGSPSFYEVDVTSTVQGWVDGGSNYGFKFYTSQNDVSGKINSGDNPDVSKRPSLKIKYSPK